MPTSPSERLQRAAGRAARQVEHWPSGALSNVLVAEVSLKRAGVMPVGCVGKAARVAQHVRMGLEAEVGLHARLLDHASKARGAERCATLRCEYKGRLGFLFAL